MIILDENKVLSKVMEKITSEYEELKKVYEGMKCPKDDKIQALRSTARALETENELLMEEKRKIEGHSANIRAIYDQKVADLERENRASKEQLKVGFSEKKSMLEQIERMESEKIGMKQQLNKLEKDLASAKKEIEKVLLGEIINIYFFLFSFLSNFVCFFHHASIIDETKLDMSQSRFGIDPGVE